MAALAATTLFTACEQQPQGGDDEMSEKEIAQVEDKWTFPRYKMKSKKLALEV